MRQLYSLLKGYLFFRRMGGGLWGFIKLLTGIVEVNFKTDCHDVQTTDRIVPSRIQYVIQAMQAYVAGQFQIGFSLFSRIGNRVRNGGRKLPLDIELGNAAPRFDESDRMEADPMVMVHIPIASLLYIGTGGRCLSFIADLIDWKTARILNVAPIVTDYRSAWLPKALERILLGDQNIFAGPLLRESVPSLPTERFVAGIDSFGNVMSIGPEIIADGQPLAFGDNVRVLINGKDVKARFVEKLGDGHKDEFVLAEGSTSRDCKQKKKRVLYLYQMLGNASEAFRVTAIDGAILCGSPCTIYRVRTLSGSGGEESAAVIAARS